MRRCSVTSRVLQRYAWHAHNSQIYPELKQLAADGFVTAAEKGPRGRRTYAITESGLTELRRWMLSPPSVFTVRNEFVLRLFLLAALDADQAREFLDQVLAESAAEYADLREQVDKFDATHEPDSLPPIGRLVAEYGLRSFQTMHDWASWAQERVSKVSCACR